MHAQSCCLSVAYKNQLFFDVVVVVQEKNADITGLIYTSTSIYISRESQINRKNVIRLLCVIIGSL